MGQREIPRPGVPRPAHARLGQQIADRRCVCGTSVVADVKSTEVCPEISIPARRIRRHHRVDGIEIRRQVARRNEYWRPVRADAGEFGAVIKVTPSALTTDGL